LSSARAEGLAGRRDLDGDAAAIAVVEMHRPRRHLLTSGLGTIGPDDQRSIKSTSPSR
jgi:hypothetical protein